MALFALYNPARPHELVTDAKGNVVTTEKDSPTKADMPPGTPQGHYWLHVTDEDDTRFYKFVSSTHTRGTPEIIWVPPGKAIRRFPILPKAKV